METQTKEKKRGPVPGPETVKATILIDPVHAEWGKHQPGGLSHLVRRLLQEAYEEAQRNK
jgi:hypothetical protein